MARFPSFCAKSGHSLLEVIIALGILALALTTLFPYLNSQLSQIQLAQGSFRASSYAEEGIEAARSIRDRAWDQLATGTHGLVLSNAQWSFQGTSDQNGDLVRSLTITDISENERQVSSRVTWNSSSTIPGSIRFTTVLANWRNIPPPLLRGDWRNPQTLGSVDLGPGNSATGLAVQSKIVYLSAEAADSKKPDFYIVDATNGNTPIIKGKLDTGPGLNDVVLRGSYALVANQDTNDQLQVIDVSSSTAPFLRTEVNLTGNNQPALSIYTTGTYAYVGTSLSASGPEFFVVDVSNPISPVIRGSLEIGASVNKISFYQNRVFLATSKDTAEMMVLDVTTSTSPMLSASYNATGTQDGLGIYVNNQDGRAYLTRGSGSQSNPEVYILSVTTPETPTLLGTKYLGTDVNAVLAADSLGFFATSNSNEEFKIYDVTNPANISYYSGLNFAQVGTDLALEDNVIYMSVRSNDALRIITSP